MRVPISTYRLQLTPEFGFAQAGGVVAYLRELGVGDIYASPIFQARPGSHHGYDVVDPNRLSSDLGGTRAFLRLCRRVRGAGLGWLQDVVPNHMAFDGQNRMLVDVFENRENSQYYHFFDIDWVHPYESFQGRVLAPFLGRFYSECLEDGELQISYDREGLAVRYYQLRLPLSLASYPRVFLPQLAFLEERLGKTHPQVIKFIGVVRLFEQIAARANPGQYDQITHAKRMLWDLYQEGGTLREYIDHVITLVNGVPRDPASFQWLDELLSQQCYRLSFWKVASEELNYRRFFTVNDIIALRAEKPEVFETTHALIFRLLSSGRITGLRIDHIDGLYDPTAYLAQLRGRVGETFVVVEKILEDDERIPLGWPVQGTTGYDFLNCVNGLFCSRRGHKELARTYYQFARLSSSLPELIIERKRLVLGKHMAGDVDNLAFLMKRVAARDRYGRDITLYGLRRALIEVMVFFPVYRTYMTPERALVADTEFIERAIAQALDRSPHLVYELRFIERFLSRQLLAADLTDEEQSLFWHFLMRFQQITAPLMAKGYEDTVLYIYNKLISVNEVGGNPRRAGTSVVEFHEFNRQRAGHYPYTLNATATHDTKRGEDVRARINALSECPDQWRQQLRVWRSLNRRKKQRRGRAVMPDANDEYFLYQTLLGSFPFVPFDLAEYRDRIKAYVIKAVREAKVHTAWIKPDSEYEAACEHFVEALLADGPDNDFLPAFRPFQERVAYWGLWNSLSQVMLKLTAPGVPDIYQGGELWDLNLVDPDNRRPVDFARRQAYLAELRQAGDLRARVDGLLRDYTDGRVKLFLTHRVLLARRESPEVFSAGEYLPLTVSGQYADQVVAFARRQGETWALIVAPRLLAARLEPPSRPLGREFWGDTRVSLPEAAPARWQDVLLCEAREAGKEVLVATALQDFPAALWLSRP